MSDKIVMDLTSNLCNVGKNIAFRRDVQLDDGLLSYPNAKLKNVILDFDLTFVKPNVSVVGTITCVVDGYCDRCLASITRSIELPFNQIFYKDSTDDEECYVYCDSKLDATKAVRDEIVLSLPSSFICKDDCKGLCPKCGINLNEQRCDCDTTRKNAFSVLKDLKF
ncbi:MAG: DUF177 domain-containing protein [Clostridiales bacterium]|nr:DUF177 domain-containing protein [Clostridiales bacterium]